MKKHYKPQEVCCCELNLLIVCTLIHQDGNPFLAKHTLTYFSLQ